MDISFYIAVASAILSSGVAILAIIAPKTKTTKDDKWLERILALEKTLEGLVKK